MEYLDKPVNQGLKIRPLQIDVDDLQIPDDYDEIEPIDSTKNRLSNDKPLLASNSDDLQNEA